MAYNRKFDSYQPSLFIKHVDGRTHPDEIYQILSELDFGVIKSIHVKPPRPGQTLTTAFVSFRYWKTDLTETTRDMLRSGKFLTVYYSDKYFWKIYEFNPKRRENVSRSDTKDASSLIESELQKGEEGEIFDSKGIETRTCEFLPMTPDGSPPSTPRQEQLSTPRQVQFKKYKKASPVNI
jgi:hypothetical protein